MTKQWKDEMVQHYMTMMQHDFDSLKKEDNITRTENKQTESFDSKDPC